MRIACAAVAALLAGPAMSCQGKGQPGAKARAQTNNDDPEPEPLERKAPSNGFNDAIAWQPLDEALDMAKERNQPVMLVVHASWCKRCAELKTKFASDDELLKLSEHFVMVNADQDREPKSLEFAPDGEYIPRVVFIDSKTGKLDESLLNERRTRTRYFYTPRDDLAGVMKEAISRYGKT